MLKIKNIGFDSEKLQKKCEQFIRCLDEFKENYLSDDFNSETISGQDQKRTVNDAKKWLRAVRGAEQTDGRDTAQLRSYAEKLGACCRLAKKYELDTAIIKRFTDTLSDSYSKKCDEIHTQNKQILECNNKAKAAYERKLALYEEEMKKYRVQKEDFEKQLESCKSESDKNRLRVLCQPKEPLKPREPRYATEIPLPQEISVPQRMNEELFDKICKIIMPCRLVRLPNRPGYPKSTCDTFVVPLLDMALRYCDELTGGGASNDSRQVFDNYLERAKQECGEKIYRCLCLLCSCDKRGVPFIDDKTAMGDIYWTSLFMNCAVAFNKSMNKFKSHEVGSSATKKWIDKATKFLSKEVSGRTYEEILQNKLDNLASALQIKAPLSISVSATIKQESVKKVLESLRKYVLDAAKKIPISNR